MKKPKWCIKTRYDESMNVIVVNDSSWIVCAEDFKPLETVVKTKEDLIELWKRGTNKENTVNNPCPIILYVVENLDSNLREMALLLKQLGYNHVNFLIVHKEDLENTYAIIEEYGFDDYKLGFLH